ncbi:hypothetical protein O9H85_04570 [Paenibacillus filicis]|uniref:CBS domain-containing protein n=1 Tax=Paenibacillus gyeongsangnamensis TaxID=3388067 RepID=A0ABT4Q4B0_9BACL|nr:hypothetical protein [Paenibacillus filicis]MCZ8511710.1 hypothetical protein [Paenibacillus filicis]
MDYAIWNPWPWVLFAIGILFCIISVSTFHKKYPHFPWGNSNDHLKAQDVSEPFTPNARNLGALPKWRVKQHTPIAEVKKILSEGIPYVGVEDEESNLVGIIGPKHIPLGVHKFK